MKTKNKTSEAKNNKYRLIALAVVEYVEKTLKVINESKLNKDAKLLLGTALLFGISSSIPGMIEYIMRDEENAERFRQKHREKEVRNVRIM